MATFINVNAPRVFSVLSLNLRGTDYQFFTSMQMMFGLEVLIAFYSGV